jgi:hypothetical protein
MAGRSDNAVTHRIDAIRYSTLFAEQLKDAGLAAHVQSANLSPGAHQVLQIVIGIADETDWELRYHVLKQASDFQTSRGTPVICIFQPLTHIACTA